MSIVELPEFGSLPLWIPLMMCVAERKYPFLGAGAFLISPGSTKDAIVLALVQRLTQGLGLHHIGMYPTPVNEGTDSLFKTILVGVDDQL